MNVLPSMEVLLPSLLLLRSGGSLRDGLSQFSQLRVMLKEGSWVLNLSSLPSHHVISSPPLCSTTSVMSSELSPISRASHSGARNTFLDLHSITSRPAWDIFYRNSKWKKNQSIIIFTQGERRTERGYSYDCERNSIHSCGLGGGMLSGHFCGLANALFLSWFISSQGAFFWCHTIEKQ